MPKDLTMFLIVKCEGFRSHYNAHVHKHLREENLFSQDYMEGAACHYCLLILYGCGQLKGVISLSLISQL